MCQAVTALNYHCRSCAEGYLGKACPLCGVPSHVKDAQPNRQLGAATSLCGRLMVILGLNDHSGHKPETDHPVFDKDLLSSEASNLPGNVKEKKTTSTEEERIDSSATDIRPRATLVRKRSGNLKVANSKSWNEKVGVHRKNEDGDVGGRTGDRECEADRFLGDNLSDFDQQSSSAKSESSSGKDIDEKDGRPSKRMRVQTRPDIKVESGVKEGKKRLSLEASSRKAMDAKANDTTDDETRGDEEQQDDESGEVQMRGRKRRKVLPGETGTTATSGHSHLECNMFKSEKNGRSGDGKVPSETQSASEEKEVCGSASRSRRRNVQMPNNSNKQKVNSRRSNDITGMRLKPKDQKEFASPRVSVKADISSAASSEHLLSDMFSTPKSQSTGRRNFRSPTAVCSPTTPQLQNHCLVTPKSELVTPRTRRSPATPTSGRGSAQKRNEKGETRLHVACIKVMLLMHYVNET